MTPAAVSAWDHAWPILLDKGLLGAVSLVVAFLFARRLERHKRREALALELEKAQAQAFVKTARSIMRALAIMRDVLDCGHRVDDLAKGVGYTPDDLRSSLREMVETYDGERFLLTPEMAAAVQEAWKLAWELLELAERSAPFPNIGQRLGDLVTTLRLQLPAFELPDPVTTPRPRLPRPGRS